MSAEKWSGNSKESWCLWSAKQGRLYLEYTDCQYSRHRAELKYNCIIKFRGRGRWYWKPDMQKHRVCSRLDVLSDPKPRQEVKGQRRSREAWFKERSLTEILVWPWSQNLEAPGLPFHSIPSMRPQHDGITGDKNSGVKLSQAPNSLNSLSPTLLSSLNISKSWFPPLKNGTITVHHS